MLARNPLTRPESDFRSAKFAFTQRLSAVLVPESLWELQPRRLEIARRYLDVVSRRWDAALERLREAVEG